MATNDKTAAAALAEPKRTKVRIPEHVVHRTFASETVALNLDTGQYHGLNHTAGRMLEVVGLTGDLERAAHELAAEFDQPLADIQRDLQAFCRQLGERGLVEVL